MSSRIDSTNCTHEAALARIAELESKLGAAEVLIASRLGELQNELIRANAMVDHAQTAAFNRGKEIEALRSRLGRIIALVNEQAGVRTVEITPPPE